MTEGPCQHGECRTESPHMHMLCPFHWNVVMLRYHLREAISWDSRGPLDPSDSSDKRVLDFYEHLVYWAAKGVGDKGIVK
jgi:hypothetical protein